jgi:hypothetical protein
MDSFCPIAGARMSRMNNPNPPPKRKLIQLELELEFIAGNYDAAKCRAVAKVYIRWAHQLEIKASVLDAHARPVPRPVLPRLSRRKLLRN